MDLDDETLQADPVLRDLADQIRLAEDLISDLQEQERARELELRTERTWRG